MNGKWIGFALVAALMTALAAGSAFSRPQDDPKHKDKESELGKLMEKVQKHNIAISKATRNLAQYKKGQKEVEKSALEFVKLAKAAKPFKDSLKNAKDEPNPQKKWDEIMDAFAKTSQDLADIAAKDGSTQKQAKDQFQVVKKTCSDCHTVFRVEEDF